MKVDLHIHSIFSDSSRTPEEICHIAKKKGIGLISICDHYTIDAYDHLFSACYDNNIDAVLGIELDANWNNENFHVLAYNFDMSNTRMRNFINSQYEKSQSECEQIISGMSNDYPQMSLDDYKKYEYPREKGGWKYIYYAVAKGAAPTYEKASHFFGKYFKPDLRTFSLPDFCAIVRQAGGVPVLAHPGYIYDRNPDNFGDMVMSMIDCGINGIECYYPSHSKKAIKECIELCKKNNLRVTGGCDCHGEFDKSSGFTVGGIDISSDMLDLKGIF